MAPSSSPAGRVFALRRKEVVRRPSPPPSPPPRKYRSMEEVMKYAAAAVLIESNNNPSDDEEDYSDVVCEQCGSGERPDEILLCDRCDKGFHMLCLRPIVVRIPIGSWYCPSCSDQPSVKRFPQTKIIDFFRIQKCGDSAGKCASPQDSRKRRRRASMLVFHKKRRRLLPFTPTEDPTRRLEQMGSLASALTALHMEFSDQLSYMPGMAPRSANQAEFENHGMQVLSKEDTETLEHCRAMYKRGECPPLRVVFDSCEGFTVEADGPIKDMTLITDYTGDVDYITNREHDDCDSMMTLLLAKDPSNSLLICLDKRGNIACFINGINNHTPAGQVRAVREILQERLMLNTLQFNMSIPAPCVFLISYLKAAQSDRKISF